jgi:hypothetical protein
LYQHDKHWDVLNKNLIPKIGVHYNFKGFAVGNGATNWKYDNAPSVPATL